MMFPNTCVAKGSKDGRELKTHQKKKKKKEKDQERKNMCKTDAGNKTKHNKMQMLHPYKIIYGIILDLKN